MGKINNQKSFQSYLNQIGNYPLLSKEEEYELAIRKENGDVEARQTLINSNLRLVVNLANQYNCHQDIQDLISDGNYGLVHAVDKFKPEQNTRISTYVTPWIRKYQLKEIEEDNKYSNTKVFFCNEDGNKEEVKTKIISLDSLVNDDSDTSLVDTISDSSNLADSIYNEDLEYGCKKALSELTEIEQVIINHRLGLYDNEKLSVRELSKRLDLTPYEVSKIYKEASNKLSLSTTLKQTYADYIYSALYE